MEVSGQLHVPAFLSSGKFQVSSQQKSVSSQIHNGHYREDKRLKVIIPKKLTLCSSIDVYRLLGAR
jgi:hypothetical protein